MKTIESFLCNFGWSIPLGSVGLSYLEPIDAYLKTGTLLFGLLVGIATFVIQVKKIFEKKQ